MTMRHFSQIRFGEAGKIRSIPILLILSTLIIIIYLFPESTLGPLGRFLLVQERLEKSDAVVLLLGGDSPDRLLAAEEIYRRGLAPKIVLGSGFLDKEFLSRAPQSLLWEGSGQGLKRSILSLGVPEADIIMVDSSNAYDTSGELTSVVEEVRRLGFRRVILVTSATHSRRVRYIWNRVGSDVIASTFGAPDPKLDHWWHYGRAIRSIGYEYVALVKEFVRRIIS